MVIKNCNMKNTQLNLWSGLASEKNEPTGEQLRDEGIERSKNHANNVINNWSEHAFNFLLKYIQSHSQFTTEDVRNASIIFVPRPPDNRAWGAVVLRAVKSGLIKRIDFTTAKNATSHCATIAIWQVK